MQTQQQYYAKPFTPFPFKPNRVASHSAPVFAFERRNHFAKNIILKTWLKTGHSQGIQMLFIPYTKHNETIHMVPLISNISEASLKPNIYQGKFFHQANNFLCWLLLFFVKTSQYKHRYQVQQQ